MSPHKLTTCTCVTASHSLDVTGYHIMLKFFDGNALSVAQKKKTRLMLILMLTTQFYCFFLFLVIAFFWHHSLKKKKRLRLIHRC